MKKKILLFVGLPLVLIIGILLVLPFFYSLDQFRPQIKAAIEKNIQAQVELGKINFRLFPSIRIGVEAVKVTPTSEGFNDKNLFSLNKFEVQMPLYSILVAPSLNIFVENPVIHLIQNGNQNSITVLFPESSVGGESQEAVPSNTQNANNDSGAPPQAIGEILSTLPPFISKPILGARLSFELARGEVTIEDRSRSASAKDSLAISDLNVALKNIGLSAPMTIQVSVSPRIQSSGAKVSGVVNVNGSLQVTPEGKNNRVSLKIEKNMQSLDIAYPPLFHKASGTPFSVVAEGTILQSPKSFEIDFSNLGLKFANVIVGGNLQGNFPVANPTDGSLKTQFNVKDFEITPWGELVPMVKQFGLGGRVNLDLKAQGKVLNPNIDMQIVLTGIKGATPELKKPLTDLNGKITVAGTANNLSVNVSPMSLKIGRSDMDVSVKADIAKTMSANIVYKSNLIDVDELLGLEALKIGDEKEVVAAALNAPKDSTVPPDQTQKEASVAAAPLDESLAQMAPMIEEQLKNPMLDTVSAKISANIKKIRALGADFTDANLMLALVDRKLTMSRTGINAYGGGLMAEMKLDLNPEAFGFLFDAGLKGVRIENMTGIHAPSWRKDLTGEMTGKFFISGLGLRKEQLEKNLKGELIGEVKQGQLILPVVKMVSMAMEAVPKLKGVGSSVADKGKDRAFRGDFKTLKLDTAIEGRAVRLRDLDINYDSREAGLGEIRFQSTGTVSFDRMIDILGTAFLSPEVVRIPELRGPSGKIEIPLKMTGDMSNPQTDTAYTLKILTERATKNFLQGQLAQKAKAEADRLKAIAEEEKRKAEAAAKAQAEAAAKRALDEAAKKAPEPVKKGVEELKKKFKF